MSPHKPTTQELYRRQVLKAGLAATVTTVAPRLATAGSSTSSSAEAVTWMSGLKLRDLIASKALSPVEVTRHFLDRIDRIDPKINAYITVDADGALAQARTLEKAIMRGEPLGPMHGLPVSIKDLAMTRGLRTTYGSLIYKDTVPAWDEILVERLRAAGAVILGKTNTPEFGKFPRTKTFVAGETLNPWDTDRISGASSGGSAAAVAAGISCFAIASDGGGSTRIPACFNGVFGLQPSAGRVPMRIPRKVPMSSMGPTTLHVEDSALIMSVIGGPDSRDPSAIESANPDYLGCLGTSLEGSRIAWTPDFGRLPTLDSRVTAAAERAVKQFSDVGIEVDAPGLHMPEQSWEVFWTINAAETGNTLNNLTPEQFALLTPPLKALHERIEAFPPMTPEREMAALEQRAGLARWANGVFDRFDLICSPTVNMVAPPIPEGWKQPYEHPLFADQISTPFTHIANVLGLPAATVPCGFVDGMPVGMQIIGRRFDDASVLRAAYAFSRVQPWMHHHPELAG